MQSGVMIHESSSTTIHVEELTYLTTRSDALFSAYSHEAAGVPKYQLQG